MGEEDVTKPIYHIGAVAALTGVHPQTLRMYERLGLVRPSRSRGNTRLYSEHDVERVRFIVHLTRDEGVNLAGVAKIAALQDRIRDVEAALMTWMERWYERAQQAEAARREALTSSEPSGRTIKVAVQRG